MRPTLRPSTGTALALAVTAALTGCGDATGVSDAGSVAIAFRVGGAPTLASVVAGGAGSAPARVAGPPLTIDGSNGELIIDEIRLIVAEAELDGDDDRCEDSDGDDDSSSSSGSSDGEDCAKFEAPPRFLDLPLDGQPIDVFVGQVPPGVYDEVEFEIEDLEDDGDDVFAAVIEALRTSILAVFPDWPR